MRAPAEMLRILAMAAVLACLLPHLACLGAARPDGAKTYDASWESLVSHDVPEWLLDAKFGIYAHWGVYSVPAFGNEWYARRMYDKKDKMKVYDFHRKKYGDPSTFGYKDLIPLFTAEKYDPDAWADLIAKSGAKYAGIAVVHHDGFGLWDSDVSQWNAGKMGPNRDLYGDLVQSLRTKEGMKIIATFHHIRTFDWFLPGDPQAVEEGRKAGWDLFDPKYANFYWNRFTGKYEDFITQWRAKVREVTDKYQPDVVWFDGGTFQDAKSQKMVLSILSYYYNQGETWGKPVEVLNKLPTSMKFNFPRGFGVLTYEEGRDREAKVDRPWIDDMKISTFSWGYIEGQTYKRVDEILDGLIDRVSRGGGLLLSLCPLADGTLNKPQKDILLAMGGWLKTNGEAIYGTRPWKIHAEGSEDHIRVKQGKHPKWVFGTCGAGDIRFTRSKDGKTLYAIALGWPKGGTLTIRTLGTGTKVSSGGIAGVSLLGCDQELTWTRGADGLIVNLPAKKPHDYAYAFRIDVKGELEK